MYFYSVYSLFPVTETLPFIELKLNIYSMIISTSFFTLRIKFVNNIQLLHARQCARYSQNILYMLLVNHNVKSLVFYS